MFDVGFWELALISVVALLILGPERLPQAARTAGLWVGKARRMLREVKSDIDRELREHEVADLGALKKDIQSAGEPLKDAAEQLHASVGAQGLGDSLKESFQQAAPPGKDDQSEPQSEPEPAGKSETATAKTDPDPDPAPAQSTAKKKTARKKSAGRKKTAKKTTTKKAV